MGVSRPASPSPGPAAVTAPSRRPLPGCDRGGRAAAPVCVRREVARSSPVPSRELGSSGANSRRWPHRVALILRDSFPLSFLWSPVTAISKLPRFSLFLPLGPLCRRGVFLDLIAVNRRILGLFFPFLFLVAALITAWEESSL